MQVDWNVQCAGLRPQDIVFSGVEMFPISVIVDKGTDKSE